MAGIIPSLDLVNINVHTKFGLTSVNGHNYVTNAGEMMCNNQIQDVSISMHILNLVKLYQFILMILSGNKILTSIKGDNTITNVKNNR